MKLVNTTNIPNEKVRKIIQFVKLKLPGNSCDIEVRNTKRGFCGSFTPSIKELAGKETRSTATIMVVRERPLVYVGIQQDEKEFPIFEDRKSKPRTTRIVKLYYEKYDEKNEKYMKWYSWRRIPITKAYVERRNSQLRDKGKSYSYSLETSTGGYVSSLILSRDEALVHVLAHEFRHYWQYHHPGKRGKVWGARGLVSERDADAYAIRKMRQWRRQHNNNCVKLGSWP
jgi:hypothetical protein